MRIKRLAAIKCNNKILNSYNENHSTIDINESVSVCFDSEDESSENDIELSEVASDHSDVEIKTCNESVEITLPNIKGSNKIVSRAVLKTCFNAISSAALILRAQNKNINSGLSLLQWHFKQNLNNFNQLSQSTYWADKILINTDVKSGVFARLNESFFPTKEFVADISKTGRKIDILGSLTSINVALSPEIEVKHDLLPPLSSILVPNPVVEQHGTFINAGSYIRRMSWAPVNPDLHREQYLAVAVYRELTDRVNIYERADGNSQLIQIYNCGDLTMGTSEAHPSQLEMVFTHSWGKVTDISWSPQPLPAVSRTQKLIGHLAICCSDGYIRIVPIKKLRRPGCLIELHKRHPILCLSMPSKHEGKTVFPTSMHWRSEFPDRIVAGYNNGHVALFVLETSVFSSRATIVDVDVILKPCSFRCVFDGPCRSVQMSPYDWHLVSCSSSSCPNTVIIDFSKSENNDSPCNIDLETNIGCKILWPCPGDVIVLSSGKHLHNTPGLLVCSAQNPAKRAKKHTLPEISSIELCQSLNIVPIGTRNGQLRLLSLNINNINQLLKFRSNIKQSHDSPMNSKFYFQYHLTAIDNPESPDESSSKYWNTATPVCICAPNLQCVHKLISKFSISISNKAANESIDWQLSSMLNINEIAANPNPGSCTWIAISLECGLIHLVPLTHFYRAEFDEISTGSRCDILDLAAKSLVDEMLLPKSLVYNTVLGRPRKYPAGVNYAQLYRDMGKKYMRGKSIPTKKETQSIAETTTNVSNRVSDLPGVVTRFKTSTFITDYFRSSACTDSVTIKKLFVSKKSPSAFSKSKTAAKVTKKIKQANKKCSTPLITSFKKKLRSFESNQPTVSYNNLFSESIVMNDTDTSPVKQTSHSPKINLQSQNAKLSKTDNFVTLLQSSPIRKLRSNVINEVQILENKNSNVPTLCSTPLKKKLRSSDSEQDPKRETTISSSKLSDTSIRSFPNPVKTSLNKRLQSLESVDNSDFEYKTSSNLKLSDMSVNPYHIPLKIAGRHRLWPVESVENSNSESESPSNIEVLDVSVNHSLKNSLKKSLRSNSVSKPIFQDQSSQLKTKQSNTPIKASVERNLRSNNSLVNPDSTDTTSLSKKQQPGSSINFNSIELPTFEGHILRSSKSREICDSKNNISSELKLGPSSGNLSTVPLTGALRKNLRSNIQNASSPLKISLRQRTLSIVSLTESDPDEESSPFKIRRSDNKDFTPLKMSSRKNLRSNASKVNLDTDLSRNQLFNETMKITASPLRKSLKRHMVSIDSLAESEDERYLSKVSPPNILAKDCATAINSSIRKSLRSNNSNENKISQDKNSPSKKKRTESSPLKISLRQRTVSIVSLTESESDDEDRQSNVPKRDGFIPFIRNLRSNCSMGNKVSGDTGSPLKRASRQRKSSIDSLTESDSNHQHSLSKDRQPNARFNDRSAPLKSSLRTNLRSGDSMVNNISGDTGILSKNKLSNEPIKDCNAPLKSSVPRRLLLSESFEKQVSKSESSPNFKSLNTRLRKKSESNDSIVLVSPNKSTKHQLKLSTDHTIFNDEPLKKRLRSSNSIEHSKCAKPSPILRLSRLSPSDIMSLGVSKEEHLTRNKFLSQSSINNENREKPDDVNSVDSHLNESMTKKKIEVGVKNTIKKPSNITKNTNTELSKNVEVNDLKMSEVIQNTNNSTSSSKLLENYNSSDQLLEQTFGNVKPKVENVNQSFKIPEKVYGTVTPKNNSFPRLNMGTGFKTNNTSRSFRRVLNTDIDCEENEEDINVSFTQVHVVQKNNKSIVDEIITIDQDNPQTKDLDGQKKDVKETENIEANIKKANKGNFKVTQVAISTESSSSKTNEADFKTNEYFWENDKNVKEKEILSKGTNKSVKFREKEDESGRGEGISDVIDRKLKPNFVKSSQLDDELEPCVELDDISKLTPTSSFSQIKHNMIAEPILSMVKSREIVNENVKVKSQIKKLATKPSKSESINAEKLKKLHDIFSLKRQELFNQQSSDVKSPVIPTSTPIVQKSCWWNTDISPAKEVETEVDLNRIDDFSLGSSLMSSPKSKSNSKICIDDRMDKIKKVINRGLTQSIVDCHTVKEDSPELLQTFKPLKTSKSLNSFSNST